jgi:membrane-associated phospholipid phosphatase
MRSRRSVYIAMVVAVAAVGLGAAAIFAVRHFGESEKPANPIAADPLPAALFPAAEYADIAARESTAIAHADALAARWFATHGHRDDAAFARFVKAELPPPPAKDVLRRELPRLHRLEAGRTPARAHAVSWLFLHGNKDIWKLYLKQYRELVGKHRGKAAKRLVKQTLLFANTVNTGLKHSLRQPHPLQLDHTLNPIIPHPGATKAETIALDRTKFAYPSNHTNISQALATVLAYLEPHRAPEFQWMAGEVSYSRLVAGIHWEEDLIAGAFEGRLIGDYEVRYSNP